MRLNQKPIAWMRMIPRFAHQAVLFSLIACLFSSGLQAQSMERLSAERWKDGDIAVTYDHPIFENTAHVRGTNFDTQVDIWDSYGRVRLDRKDPNSPFIAYRIFTGDVDTDARFIHSSMAEVALAGGFTLGTAEGWKYDLLLGAGYSGTHPFLNEKGIFGVGDLTATRQITQYDRLLLGIDYAGNSELLPDVPLPGFAWLHDEPNFSFELGFPINQVQWHPIESLTFSAAYAVPFTAKLDVEYMPWKHAGFYAHAANFFEGFVIAKQQSVNRQMFQFRHVEAGVRLVFDPLVDASIGVGYAFDQTISDGFDVRNLTPVAQVSDAPYVAIVLRGRF